MEFKFEVVERITKTNVYVVEVENEEEGEELLDKIKI